MPSARSIFALISPKLEKGQEISREILAKVQGVPGSPTRSSSRSSPILRSTSTSIAPKSAYLGLTADDVIKNIITALNSSVLFSPNFWDDPVSGNNYFIGAMYPEKEISSTETIKDIPLLAPKRGARDQPIDGESAPQTLLRNVATVTPATVPVEISHLNIQRVFDVMANVEGRDIGSVASDIDMLMKTVKLPKGFSLKWVGQVDAMRASFGSMGVGMTLSLVLVFLLMVAQLKSFVDPLLIMATVPMGFIGVFWMLFLTNTTINIQSMMGMIMLIGIVVSNTVILTDFANQRIADGVEPFHAIREAGITRLASDSDDGDLSDDGAPSLRAERRQRTAGSRGHRRPAQLDVSQSGVPARSICVSKTEKGHRELNPCRRFYSSKTTERPVDTSGRGSSRTAS